MRKTKNSILTCMVFALVCGCAVSSWGYDYPFDDPYVATVLGTPREYMMPLPPVKHLKKLRITVFKERKVPDVLWYEKNLKCSLAYQKREAPLVFIVAGTGASYNSPKMQLLQRALYAAGLHVVCISSPTHINFIASASLSMVPGRIQNDSEDLYRVMGMIWQKIQKKVTVSEFYLTGYSLGASQSAFLTKIDDERGFFGFKKVLMINPSVNLLTSVAILDKMLEENIPGGLDNFDEYYNRMMRSFSDIYKRERIDFNDEFLLNIYKGLPAPPKDENLEALIGLSFRISLANMAFASDVLTQAGYVVPREKILSRSDILTDYGKVHFRLGFSDFVDGIIYPYYHSREPDLTKEILKQEVGLEIIADYLSGNSRIGMITNADDVILAPGQIDFLRQTFGTRAKIFPNGGHCGNIAHRDFIGYVMAYFQK